MKRVSDNYLFAHFCNSVNIGKENFGIVTLWLFWSRALLWISVEAFLCEVEMTQRKDHYSEVEKNVTKVLVLFECTVIRQYYVPKMKLPFSLSCESFQTLGLLHKSFSLCWNESIIFHHYNYLQSVSPRTNVFFLTMKTVYFQCSFCVYLKIAQFSEFWRIQYVAIFPV